VREESESWDLSLSGEEQNIWSETTGDVTKGGITGWVGPLLRDTPTPILTCSLSIVSTCGKKTTHERTGRRQGREIVDAPLVLDSREVSRL
jgi:hypothetical protein